MTAEDTGTDSPEVAPAAAPHIEVVGDASPEQVAALVAVLSGVGGGEEEPSDPASRWASRERLVRAPLHPAPGAWRASAFPG